MNDKLLRGQLDELAEIASTPLSSEDSETAEGTYISEHRRAGQTNEELLLYIRLRIKYLMFDLEATRRENRYLREMIDRQRGRRDNDER